MNQDDILLYRIITGQIRFKTKNETGKTVTLVIKPFQLDDKQVSAEKFAEYYEEAKDNGLFEENELLDYMYRNELWDEVREKMIAKLQEDIEKFKVGLFELRFKPNESKQTRAALNFAKQELGKLREQRGLYYHSTCKGVAEMGQIRYLIGRSLHNLNGNLVVYDEDFQDGNHFLLDNAVEHYLANRISETEYRRIARSESWRTIWNCRGNGSPYNVSAIFLTDEQKYLQNWSMMYDNIGQHEECPPQFVIEDDDALDGWLILQKEQSKQGNTERGVDALITNEKIKNSDEIYLTVNTKHSLYEEAEEVEKLNSPLGSAIKQQRMNVLQKKGEDGKEVSQFEFPDIRQQARNAYAEMQQTKG